MFRTAFKYILVPIVIQFVISFITIAYNIAYGNQQKILDLTWELNNETIYWPGVQKFQFTRKIADSQRGYWYASNEFQTGEHGGTHMDAPYHFNKEGWKIADIPIERFFANEVEAGGPDFMVDSTLLMAKMEKFEPVQNNTVLLIKYGWSKYWPDEKKFMRIDEEGTLHFPGLDESSATYIANNGRFIGIGVDTASADAGISRMNQVHRIISAKNIYILENLKMTENFPEKMFTLVVAPIKITEGSGAAVRIFAVIT